LYNTSVQNTNPQLTNAAHVLIAAAGPVFSLVQGVALLPLLRRSRGAGTGSLFWLYMCVFGLINFFGYLLIAPLVAGGDTGQIVARLHVPMAAQWAVAVASLLSLGFLIGSTAPLFLRHLPTEMQAAPAARTEGMRALLLWPWLVGSVVLVLLALPAPHPAIVANIFMSPMVLRRAYRLALTGPAVATPAAEVRQWPWGLTLVVLVVAVGFRLLGRGLAW
jgi:hypothetical protein